MLGAAQGMGNMNVPAVVIAAPASGAGKTTVATGLMGALRRSGDQVAPFKVGPDYIDPGYHTLAAGRPGRNLDPVLAGAERVAPLYRYGAAGAAISVIEGVMGLFDGRIHDGGPQAGHAPGAGAATGSTAHVAALLGVPVILVVDVRGHSQSLAALLHGFTSFDPDIRIGGVILNQTGSARHEQVLRVACEQVGLPVLGTLPRHDDLTVPARHLGLIPAAEQGAAASAAVDAMTELVAAHVDIAAVRALAAPVAAGPVWDPAPDGEASQAGGPRPVVAFAAGAAFTFGYAEHAEMLSAAGADVTAFDPLRDELPTGTSALVLPGGFPEVHAGDLAANTALREQVLRLVRMGLPVHAECAGLLYLARTLDGHEMTGVLALDAEFTSDLTLGYRDATALSASPLWQVGERVTGHEFHRTIVTRAAAAGPRWAGLATGPEGEDAGHAWGWRATGGGTPVREGVAAANVHASYLHTHPAGHPAAMQRFVVAAANYAEIGASRV